MTPPKFIGDADLGEYIVRGVRRLEPAVDFLTAAEGGTRGLSDRRVLELAAIVSHDRNTMTHEFFPFLERNHWSPGLIVVSQELDIGSALEDLLTVWASSDAAEWRNCVIWIPL